MSGTSSSLRAKIADFFRSGSGVNLPNGVNDLTESISRNGSVGLNTPTPLNTIHIGSAAVPNTGGIRLPITSASVAQTGQPLGVDGNGDIIRMSMPVFDATIDFSVNANPNTAGTTFNPNTPASTTAIYVSTIDGSQWTYNGTAYITVPVSNDWKTTGNAGTVQATNFIGTTNNVGLSVRTNNVIRQTVTAAGNVGVNTTTPLSTFDVAGSVGHNITSTAAVTYTALGTDYTINLTLVGAQAVTLPAPATCTRRIVILRNATQAAKTVSSYVSFTGAASTSIPANTAVGLQSNGAQWLQISLDSAILPTVFLSATGAAGQTINSSFTTLNLSADTIIGIQPTAFINGVLTIPVTGIYQVTGSLRWADGQAAGVQFGLGVHTSNTDGPWFLWSAIENTTTTLSRRTSTPYIRTASFTAGQQIRMFSYVDGPAMPITIASMQVLLIA